MMKAFAGVLTAFVVMLATGAAQADDPKQSGPGTTGEMNKVAPSGVATDPGGVKAQQGEKSKASPGTVGAAPGADTKSQTGK